MLKRGRERSRKTKNWGAHRKEIKDLPLLLYSHKNTSWDIGSSFVLPSVWRFLNERTTHVRTLSRLLPVLGPWGGTGEGDPSPNDPMKTRGEEKKENKKRINSRENWFGDIFRSSRPKKEKGKERKEVGALRAGTGIRLYRQVLRRPTTTTRRKQEEKVSLLSRLCFVLFCSRSKRGEKDK